MIPGLDHWESALTHACRKCAIYGIPRRTTLNVHARKTKYGIRYSGRCFFCKLHLFWVKVEKVPVYIKKMLLLRLQLDKPEQVALFGDVRPDRRGGDLT